MKINIKRLESVTNNQLVQFSSPGVVEEYSNGEFAGVTEDCRQITVLENDVEVIHNICTLVIHGPCIARLSGTASQNGCDAFISGNRVSQTGTNKIGVIIPKPFPENGDYQDNDLVNIVLI